MGDKNHSYAQTETLDDLFVLLQDPDAEDVEKLEQRIWKEWSKSGSDAMDFLLERGRDEIDNQNFPKAIEHLSALIDHAPDFAEGYNARATAFYFMGELGLSMSDIRQTLALNPRHFGALDGMASILEATGRKEEALAVYRQSLEVHPHQERVKQEVERLEKDLEGTAL